MADARAVTAPSTLDGIFGNKSDIFVAAGVVSVVMMLIIPIPTILLDALMAMNLILALLILLIVLYTRKAIDFSVFPTMLLVTTVFGLALNVSSTRLILAQGVAFNGHMVRAFSSFVVGANGSQGLIVGFVIFIVIIAVQAIVITKGATRTAEVAARFTLDKMPQKQMAAETEYSSGRITEEELKKLKDEIDRESSFYGAMDGASKFISGNVKIGIFITVVNIIAGVIIGTVLRNESIGDALGVYMAFAIGDGLLSQFPSLLISTATGIIVTRSISNGTFAEDISSEFNQQPRIYWIGAAVLFIFALIPGFPWYVLIPMAALLGFFAFRLTRFRAKEEQAASKEDDSAQAKAETEDISPVAPLDPLSLELGYGLIPLVDKDKGAELMERIKMLRWQSARDLGLVIPRIRIIDNMALDPVEYCFKINGVEFGRGKIRMGYYLCVNPNGSVKDSIPGERTIDPAFGIPAIWVSEEYREEAERSGYTVVDPPSVITTHLDSIIKQHAGEILSRQGTQQILDTLRKDYPAVVEDALKSLSLGEIQKVLQGLLREQVSIRNMVAILESCADYAAVAKKSLAFPAPFLVEKVRQTLGRQICLQYADDEKKLHCITIEAGLEQKIIDSCVQTSSGPVSGMEPAARIQWLKSLANAAASMKEQGWIPPVVLVSEAARPLVKQSTERELPELAVMSVLEVAHDIIVVYGGEVRVEE